MTTTQTKKTTKARPAKKSARTTASKRAAKSGGKSAAGGKPSKPATPTTAVLVPPELAAPGGRKAAAAASSAAAQTELRPAFRPLVYGAQHARTSDLQTTRNDYLEERLRMPDFQRCANQWDTKRKSLLIESIVANYPIPPITIWPENNAVGQIDFVLDGQQRISTLLSYVDDGFACLPAHKAPYDGHEISQFIAGKRFSELQPDVQRHIQRYKLSFCVLPENLEIADRLRIFARMNQGGVVLSAHDLRLALFSQSARVHFVRLAGIYDPAEESFARMLETGKKKYNLEYPWQRPEMWTEWWQDSRFAMGQSPSEMFLFFLTARICSHVDGLLSVLRKSNHLGFRTSDTVSNTLDILCAQFQVEDKQADPINRLPDLVRLHEHFAEFEIWFNAFRKNGYPIRTGSARKIALIMAAAVECWGKPSKVRKPQWDDLAFILTRGPRTIAERFGEYPSVRGKWSTQRRQIECIDEIVQKLAA